MATEEHLTTVSPPVLSRTTTSSDEALVSVIIPCYNHARFLGEAIVSVIRQSYPHIEIIVVDDGSTDDTEQVITSYPNIQHIRQENLGVSRARNMGLSMSRGAYVLFLDADDRLLPDAVATGVHALASRKEYAFAFGLFVSIGKLQDIKKLPPDHSSTYKELLKRNFIGNPGVVLYNRWVFSHVEGFDETNGPAADYDLYLRVARQFPIFCHQSHVVEYRKHDRNMSNNPTVMLEATLTALKNQKQHVEAYQDLKAAYDSGRQFWKSYYGEALVVNVYDNLACGNVMRAACDCYALVRLFPERFPIFAARKIKKLYSALREALF
jgi:glycosyltransferase involved in cell wall biosynthesis